MAECPKYITYRKVKETETEVLYEQFLPQTNADRIRMMSDEELAKWIAYPKQQLYCCFEFGNCGDDCSECALKWLKKEVDK